MSKVTITAQPEGNEPTEIPPRAQATMAVAKGLAANDLLSAIISEARTFAAEIYEPANTAFSEADEASVENQDSSQSAALSARADELNEIWLGHADTYEGIAARILDLPAADAETAERHIRAYAELLVPFSGHGDAEDPVLRLLPEQQALVLSYLLGAIGGGLNAPAPVALPSSIAPGHAASSPPVGSRAEWDAALQEVREAEIARLHATKAQSDFEDKNPSSGDGDPEYDKLTAAWNEADDRFFRALHQLLALSAPDAAALAHQIQAHSWLTCVTNHRIDGLTSWPLDPACPKVAAAVDDAGTDDERGLLSLYRSACALAGGIKLPPLRTELEPSQLLAAE